MANLKQVLFPGPVSGRLAFGLLVLRIVAGVSFMHHGWSKIQSPMDWMGPDATVPGWLQALAALSEFGGGLAWVVGLLTRLASLGLLCTMAYATYTHAVVRGDPLVGGYELALVYFSVALMLLLVGPGTWSVDAVIGRKRRREG